MGRSMSSTATQVMWKLDDIVRNRQKMAEEELKLAKQKQYDANKIANRKIGSDEKIQQMINSGALDKQELVNSGILSKTEMEQAGLTQRTKMDNEGSYDRQFLANEGANDKQRLVNSGWLDKQGLANEGLFSRTKMEQEGNTTRAKIKETGLNNRQDDKQDYETTKPDFKESTTTTFDEFGNEIIKSSWANVNTPEERMRGISGGTSSSFDDLKKQLGLGSNGGDKKGLPLDRQMTDETKIGAKQSATDQPSVIDQPSTNTINHSKKLIFPIPSTNTATTPTKTINHSKKLIFPMPSTHTAIAPTKTINHSKKLIFPISGQNKKQNTVLSR